MIQNSKWLLVIFFLDQNRDFTVSQFFYYVITFRITKEEVEEEMAMMHKEAEMSVEELKAMYAKMAEDSANVESEEKVNSPTAPMIFALSTTTLLAKIMMI